MCGGGNAGRAVDVDARVVVAAEGSFAGMDPHPDAQIADLHRPPLRTEGALDDNGALDRARCAREGDEERIAFRRYLHAARRHESVPQDRLVSLEDRCEASAEGADEARGALDVREEERDCARREGRARSKPLLRHKGRIPSALRRELRRFLDRALRRVR